jgi:Xaa-Pro aminopeptidase
MVFSKRRERLMGGLTHPVLLFSGGLIARNYAANPYPFRPDSNFLYFFEAPEAGSAAFIDPADRSVTLFLPARTVADTLWHGELESFEAARVRHQVTSVLPVEELEAHVARLSHGRQVRSVAVADARTTERARAITGEDLSFDDAARVANVEVIDAIATLRLHKSPEELAEMRRLVPITREAHELAMRHSLPGVTEQLLAGHVEGAFARGGCVPAYNTILSVRGEVLHNHGHANTLRSGDIVLLDAGAESLSGYCTDVTRCWPVGAFSPEGREVYELVLQANVESIARVRPGVRYRDLHLESARVLTRGLTSMGLMHGEVDGLVERGAHAVFFPHGLGHQLGLDVHDLESFGDHVHYPNRSRSPQFGTQYLRMDMDLKAGMTFTIEPGLYFVPAILHSAELRARFGDAVNWAAAERFLAMNQGRGFGGVRIEDDVLCTDSGSEVLTAPIPKSLADMERLSGAGTA